MSRATELYRNRITLIFDFDDTLAPSTFHTLLSEMGYDPDKFEEERVQPLVNDDWDTTLARYYCLTEASRNGDVTVTEELMTQVGQEFPIFDHVEDMFDTVREWAQEVVPDVEVEFYMLTAGMAEIPRATPIADQFKQIWAGKCHFNDEGEIDFVKRLITHPEKIRYLTQLAKGLHLEGDLQPEAVYQEIPLEDYYVPFDQMIYVGDGGSDMPAFSLMEDHDGLSIGVVVADSIEEWRGYDDIRDDQRVQSLVIADYDAGSELMQALQHSVRSVAEKIALRQLSQGR